MVFISYRRDDSGGHVGRLYDALSARFGHRHLFFDIDHIGPGQDFVQVLDDALARSSVLLVVIGKRWAGAGRIGSRRIDDPGDFVRIEVAAGLRRTGLRVIPVLIQGAKMPSPASLPDDLKDLSRRNAVEVSDLRWKEDVARLVAGLGTTVTPTALPAFPIPRIAIPRVALPERWRQWTGAAAGVLLLGWGAHRVFARSGPAPAAARAQMAGVAAPEVKTIPDDRPVTVPDHLTTAARSALARARKWRSDAMLTEIEAELPAGGSGAPRGYQVDYDFRSPIDGAGLAVVTGATGGVRYLRLPRPTAVPHALPDSFVDLPAAVAAARVAGLFGEVRLARLLPNPGAPSRATWVIQQAGRNGRVFHIDGATGKLASAPHRGPGLITAVKGLFHHHR